MNKRLLSLAVAGSMLLGLASVASAGVPDDAISSATVANAGLSRMITPAGLGDVLAGLGVDDATVTVTVLDVTTAPIVGYPFQDITIDDDGITNDISVCNGGNVADGNTNVNGVTTFSGVISGGGFTTAGLRVYLAGFPIVGAGNLVDLNLNSPDISGDLAVDIVDFGTFGIDFDPINPYNYRSDLAFDGAVDIADFSRFGLNFSTFCP